MADPATTKRPSLTVALVASAVFVAVSANLLWLSAHHDPRVHAPLSVVIAIVVVFISGSIMMVLSALHRDRYQGVFTVLMLGGFSAAFVGIGLFGDERYCSASGPAFLPLPGCRVAFGAFGVFFGFVTLALIHRAWSRRRRSHY